MAYRILAIDDDVSILRLIKKILTLSEYEVVTCSNVKEVNLCDFIGFDLILLDVMMPMSGFELCRRIRKEVKAPILFVTAKDMEDDLVEGLKAGADDYITKPFTVKELLARIQMHLRREERHKEERNICIFGDLRIDSGEQSLWVKEEKIAFTKQEFLIISLLVQYPDRIFSVEEIYDRIYPQSSDTQFRSITEYIYQIRTKLKPHGINPIETMWGGGYRWKKS